MKKTIILSLVLALLVSGCAANTVKVKDLTPEEAKAKTLDYINNQLLVDSESKATIENVVEESGLYKFSLVVAGYNYDSYASKDGSKFFVEALNMDEKVASEDDSSVESTSLPVVNNKNSKPEVEVFVMSHCPYGTQIEKGIIPVIETLGDKADIKIKFCDYAMHGEKELDEQMNQYCIQKEEPSKFVGYLKCFLEAGDADSCLKQAGINQTKLKSCVAAAEKEYKIKENFSDKSTWLNGTYPTFGIYQGDVDKYSVSGSPALVVNGENVSSSYRDSASLLSVVCSAFQEQPAECQTQLSDATPSAGFGYGDTGASNGETCN
jgi:hypothetical protein